MVKAHSRRPNVLTEALEEASVAAHDADPSRLLGCIRGFYFNTMGLMCVSDVFFCCVKFCMHWRKFRLFTWYLVEAYLAVPQPLAFLGQMPQALDGWTIRYSANLLWSSIRLERNRQMTIFTSQQAGPLQDTRVVLKPLWCCLGLLGST